MKPTILIILILQVLETTVYAETGEINPDNDTDFKENKICTTCKLASDSGDKGSTGKQSDKSATPGSSKDAH